MTRSERLDAMMRRYLAVRDSLFYLTERERDIWLAQYKQEPLLTTAKRLKITRGQVRQIRDKVRKILLDIFFDPEGEDRNGAT